MPEMQHGTCHRTLMTSRLTTSIAARKQGSITSGLSIVLDQMVVKEERMPGYNRYLCLAPLSLSSLSGGARGCVHVNSRRTPLQHFYRVKKEISTYKNVPSPQVSARSNAISPPDMTAVNSSGWSSRLVNAKLSCLFRRYPPHPPSFTTTPPNAHRVPFRFNWPYK